MKLDCIVSNVKVLTKRVFPGKTRPDGTQNVYYMLGVQTPSEIGEVGCTLQVYDKVILEKTYDFHFIFETRYDKVYVRFDECYPATGIDKKS